MRWNDRDQKLTPTLTAAEVADLEVRQDGSLPPEARRARRHGSGELAGLAEAAAQSRLFDDLAKSTVAKSAMIKSAAVKSTAVKSAAHRRALERTGVVSLAREAPLLNRLAGDLASYRSEGLVWQGRMSSATAAIPSDEIEPAT